MVRKLSVPKFKELSKRRQARFLLQFLEILESYKSRARDLFRFSVSSPAIVHGPELFVLNGNLLWDFQFQPDDNGRPIHVELEVELERLWDGTDDEEKNIDRLLRNRIVGRIRHGCNCDASTYGFSVCPHIAASFEFLRKRLERAKTEEALDWLDSCIASPEEVGRSLVGTIEQVRKFASDAEDGHSEECRVVWRIAPRGRLADDYSAFDLMAVLQRPKGRGGWTVGKRVRDPLRELPDNALHNNYDRMLALICDSYFRPHREPPSMAVYIQVLELLRQCPHVVWDLTGSPEVEIRKAEVSVRLAQIEGSYVPEVLIDGQPKSFSCFHELNKSSFGEFFLDTEAHTIVYSILSVDQLRMVEALDAAASRGARLDRDSAEQFSKLLCDPVKSRTLPIQLPESLAGPDVILPPKIQLHLTPTDRAGLEARLRVECTVLDEPPTPGIGSERSLVHTPAGAYHIVRDLEAESSIAEQIANILRLGDFAFDGPYTWQISNLDQSLDLIERIRQLGEAAPAVCWPKSKPLRMVGDITPQTLRVRLTSDRDWFGIEGELQLDGLHIPLSELMVAIRTGGRYVPLGDNQFATISDELRARMATIDDVSSFEGGKLRMSRAAAPLIDEAIGSDIPAERDLRWQETIDRLNEWKTNPSQPPETLKAELRDYQVHGYQWLSKLSQWGLGGCLADDMGLGKTVQTLGVLFDRARLGPALIVAPTSVGINWVRETQRFAPSLNAQLYREHERESLIQSAGPGDLVIASYQLLQRDIDRIASRTWSTLVLDEAQYIKNFQTKTNQAVRRIDVDWCIALSGTPMENHLGELWSLMRVVSPGLLGSWDRFRQRFGEPIERDHDTRRLKALGHVVRPFILRRTKQEVLTELPPRTEVVLTAELSQAERKSYDAARLAAISELTAKKSDEPEQQKRIRVLAWLTRLRQLSCHPGLVDPRWTKSSAKLDLFMETVGELRANNHRALVFSQFVQHLSLVRNALDSAGISYQYLDGSTPTKRRQEAVDAFQNGDGDLFLISLKAGGTGLNLTAADYVLHMDPWWNPAVEDQATDRAHRIGQSRPVTVYRLVAKDTIEEQILAMHESKRELMSGVLEGADRAATMSTDELVQLIRDSSHLS